MVLIVEALDSSFGKTFWQFIEDGVYEHREKGLGKHQFYRFTEPKNSSFPKMIELFSKLSDNFALSFDNGLSPIHLDDSIVGLSAILLNDYYYDQLVKSRRIVDGYSVIEIETVILFKVKAWLDMKELKDAGEEIDAKNIRKHKNDVFRLLFNVTPTIRIELTNEIKHDVIQFIDKIEEDRPDLNNLGLRGVNLEDMV